jgi:hypothetical protein
MHKQKISFHVSRFDIDHHALELRPVVIARRCAGIDILRNNVEAPFCAIALCMRDLVRD